MTAKGFHHLIGILAPAIEARVGVMYVGPSVDFGLIMRAKA